MSYFPRKKRIHKDSDMYTTCIENKWLYLICAVKRSKLMTSDNLVSLLVFPSLSALSPNSC